MVNVGVSRHVHGRPGTLQGLDDVLKSSGNFVVAQSLAGMEKISAQVVKIAGVSGLVPKPLKLLSSSHFASCSHNIDCQHQTVARQHSRLQLPDGQKEMAAAMYF